MKHATGGNQLAATYRSASGLLQGHIAALVADLFATGAPPTHPLFPEMHTGATPLVVHGPALLSATGGSWTFAVPPGFAGISLVLQPLALTTQARNGLFAAGAAHEVRLH